MASKRWLHQGVPRRNRGNLLHRMRGRHARRPAHRHLLSQPLRLVSVQCGWGFTVYVRIWLTGQDEETVATFVKAIEKLPQIVECHLMAGDCDFLLRVITPDLEGFRKFQMEYIGKIKGVRNIKSEIPMQQIKRSWVVPI